MTHALHIAASVFFLSGLEDALLLLTCLRVQLSLHDVACINRFVPEDYPALAGEHFLQSPRLSEFSIPSVLSNFSPCELDVDCPHLFDPFDRQQQVLSPVEYSAFFQYIFVPLSLHYQLQYLLVLFLLNLVNQEHLSISAGPVFLQPAEEVPALVNNQAVVGSIVGLDDQSGLIRQHGHLICWLFLVPLEEQVAVTQLQWLCGLLSDVRVDRGKLLVADGYLGSFRGLEEGKSEVLIADIRRAKGEERAH